MKRYFILSILLIAIVTFGKKKEQYVKILGAEDLTVYLDKASIEQKGDDIYVWIMQTHIPPLNIESIKEKIYKSKTKYIFNPKINRYGILLIEYYNVKGDLIKKFDYSVKTNIPEYKYSYPIFEKSLEKKILNTIFYYKPELKKSTESGKKAE